MVFSLESAVPLGRGVKMPVLGLGTAGASGRTCTKAVLEALRVGYRLIDTASLYGNERDVGLAVTESGVPREELFVTTKVATREQGAKTTRKAFERSLGRLGFDYVDLYLVHWPAQKKRIATWEAMTELLEQGKTRAVGVSNFLVRHLEELREKNNVPPAVNQIELSPFLTQQEVVTYCRRQKIQVEAYSPLTRGHRLNDAAVRRVATKYRKSPAQVLIRWSLQHDFIVIPKSARPERIRENAEVFDFTLAPADMGSLDRLDRGQHFDWDPSRVP